MIVFLYICIWIVGGNCPMKVETRTPFPDTFVRENIKTGIMKVNKCSVCGSEKRVFFTKSYGDYLCGNHRNHMNRNGRILERTVYSPNKIEIKNDHAEIIICNKKLEEIARAFIDIEDIDLVKCYKWHIDGNGAITNHKVGKLHRFVLGIKNINGDVDHENRIPSDCQKHNLREISHSLNIHNGKLRTNNKSGVNGVCWNNKKKEMGCSD